MDKETQSVSSWVATANLVGDAWIRGAVPNKYAEQTLKRATEELGKEKEKIDEIKLSKDVSEHDKSVLGSEVFQLANKTEEMSRAVAQKNCSAVRQKLGELAAEKRSLNKLKKVAGQTNESTAPTHEGMGLVTRKQNFPKHMGH
ncbi:hypothetical protein PQG02_15360 [Nostoc sp. UHCC 0926]|uniref:hypothetical protein n=1 Tax=unclassified Nostoc TaxID=2593658 RepID=UPI002361C4C9|nr:hypothetical protein [Nostoc sp. UHCC 0926]WDD35608.1 hypothetical protein PQG02_15360 [Nostoc sp. UHCC 0926]